MNVVNSTALSLSLSLSLSGVSYTFACKNRLLVGVTSYYSKYFRYSIISLERTSRPFAAIEAFYRIFNKSVSMFKSFYIECFNDKITDIMSIWTLQHKKASLPMILSQIGESTASSH